MIQHPSVKSLLVKHGADQLGRQKARREIERAILADAQVAASRAGRSLRCIDGDHHRMDAGWPMGCKNDGRSCICECHDPTPMAESDQSTRES